MKISNALSARSRSSIIHNRLTRRDDYCAEVASFRNTNYSSELELSIQP